MSMAHLTVISLYKKIPASACKRKLVDIAGILFYFSAFQIMNLGIGKLRTGIEAEKNIK